jgi:hypothetical protein
VVVPLPGDVSGSHGGDCEGDLSGMLRRVVWLKFTDVSEVLTAAIIRERPIGSKHV